jgi:hypothetical protein
MAHYLHIAYNAKHVWPRKKPRGIERREQGSSMTGLRKKRPYPRKKEQELRIPVTFSLSADVLRDFREAYCISEGHEPTMEECRERARSLAFGAIGAFIRRYLENNEAMIL